MDRREFLASGMASGVAITSAAEPKRSARLSRNSPTCPSRFRLNYAPHLGMFQSLAGRDEIDQIRFLADQGFTAVEDPGLKLKSPELQERIGREVERRNMTMGLFAGPVEFAHPTFASGEKSVRANILKELSDAVAVAQRTHAKWCTVVPGKFAPRLPLERQTANVIENLRFCADVCERVGLIMLLEPLAHCGSRPALYLRSLSQAYRICKAVSSPSCKILVDLYHQYQNDGRLIANLHPFWSEIAYFQIGDSPGRKEPGTGQIPYRRLFRYIHEMGFTGLLGMDHGAFRPGADGEQAIIDAYLAHDQI